MQVGPGDEDLVLLAAKVLEELLQGGYPLRQPFLIFVLLSGVLSRQAEG